MIRTHSRRRRGSIVLGLVILVFVLVTFCGLVLGESLGMYREQVFAERREQERAGLEAAVALLIADPAADVEAIAGATFTAECGDAAVEGDVLKRSVTVAVLGRNGEPVHSASKTVVFEMREGRWTWAGVEP